MGHIIAKRDPTALVRVKHTISAYAEREGTPLADYLSANVSKYALYENELLAELNAMLTNSQHRGRGIDAVLHDKKKPTPIDRNVFRKQKSLIWKEPYGNLRKGEWFMNLKALDEAISKLSEAYIFGARTEEEVAAAEKQRALPLLRITVRIF